MNPLDNAFSAQWILTIASQFLLILAAGRLILHLVRRKNAPLRSAVSLAILAAIALLPFLHVSFNSLNISPFMTVLRLPDGSSHLAAVSGEVTAGIAAGGSTDSLPSSANRKGMPWLFGSGSPAVKFINIFGIFWALGFAVFFVRFIYGAASVRKLKKGSVPVEDPRVFRLLDETARVFARPVPPNIFESASVPCPMAAGFFKPLILLPRGLFRKLGDVELKGILLHEMSHIHHRDQTTGVLQRIAASLAWWNPLIHDVSSSLSRAREEIADNHVLRENGSKEYAECLINMAEQMTAVRRLPIVATMSSSHLALKERITSILSKERIMETRLKKQTVLGIVLVAFIFLGGFAGHRLIFAATSDSVSTSPEKIMAKASAPGRSILQKTDKPTKIKPPKLIKKVNPPYPEIARQSKVGGVVILEATTDKNGHVVETKVLRSIPLLDQAAVDAVMQWVYEPMIIDGKAIGVTFTVTVTFNPDDKRSGIEGGVEGGISAGVSGEKPAVRAVGEIKEPKLIKKVDPIYPEIAYQSKVEGVVIIEATTDQYGRVVATKVLRSIPLLDQAAVDAVRQWQYEPMIIDGKPKGVIFTVTVAFSLAGKTSGVESGIKGGVEGGIVGETSEKPAVRAVGEIKEPKLIKKVDPIYPEIARQSKVAGVVILEATIDQYGRVVEAKVLRSIPLLDQAAIDAVKQWVYEPMIIDGKARGVTFTVTVTFNPDDKTSGVESGIKGGVEAGIEGGIVGETGEKSVKAVGEIKEPKLIKKVKPIYPEVAFQSKVGGVVILEATIDQYGRVVEAKVLRSIPLLDQAAIDAVKQWVYEPMIIDGKARGVTFTVTVTFNPDDKRS